MNDIEAARVRRDDYFGVCPTCRKHDGCVSVGRTHYYVCHAHRVAWCIGSNLFSGWREMTEAETTAARKMLASYRIIEAP